MRFGRPTTDRSAFEVVVTSMLDINFLLIMFFMMTAHFQRETHAPLELPREPGEAEPRPDESGLVVNISRAGDIIVSGRTIDLPELARRVRGEVARAAQAGAGSPVKLMVCVDRNAPTDHLNRVVGMLREEGVAVIRLATVVPI
jgi:biopolymer transport protein ExbD